MMVHFQFKLYSKCSMKYSLDTTGEESIGRLCLKWRKSGQVTSSIFVSVQKLQEPDPSIIWNISIFEAKWSALENYVIGYNTMRSLGNITRSNTLCAPSCYLVLGWLHLSHFCVVFLILLLTKRLLTRRSCEFNYGTRVAYDAKNIHH